MKVLVVGMGISGYAAAELSLGQGHSVLACDQTLAEQLKVDLAPLLARGLVFYGGSESPALLDGVQAVVLSPGVPRASTLVRAAIERGIPVHGELEWGYRHARGRVIAVTGSNGKSTTTSLVGLLMAAHFPDVRTGGNLGTPFCSMVGGSTAETWWILEASSFQLESVETFHANVAVLLNITPDHQDRYARFEDYAEAKARVFLNQGERDFAVFSATDPLAEGFGLTSRAAHVRFSATGQLGEGASVRDGVALWRRGGGEETLFPAADLSLPGVHNMEDALAACLAARCAGVPPGGLAPALRSFTGLPHRLEKVGVVNGASVYNDSKATNTDAVLKALTAFESGVVLLLGGKDKGADWGSLAGEIRARCKAVVAFGAARENVVDGLSGVLPAESFASLKDATARALQLAGPGDSVVLSPACASFDEFRNFEDRGERFKAWVKEAVG
jgi:UDP-N-acetylmuramoylalanine--D-glutamate ligase